MGSGPTTERDARYVCRRARGEIVCYDRRRGTLSHEPPGPLTRPAEQVLELSTFDEMAPLKLYYDPTYRCNLRCRHCITESSPQRDTADELDARQAAAMLRELGRVGVFEVQYGGGEPLCHPGLFRLLEVGRDAGLNQLLTTNGLLITRAVARRLARLDLLEIRVSFEGDEPFHETIRGRGTYRKALRAVAELVESGVRTVARLTLCRGSDEGLPALFEDLAARGVKRLKGVTIKGVGRASCPENRELLGYPTDRATARRLQTLGAEHGIVVELSADDFSLDAEAARDRKPRFRHARNCGSGFETAYVAPDGGVHPCAGLRAHAFGTVRSMSFMEAWTSPEADAFRRMATACAHRRLCDALIEHEPPRVDA